MIVGNNFFEDIVIETTHPVKKGVGRIVDGMTITDAYKSNIKHLSINEAEELYNNSMKVHENHN